MLSDLMLCTLCNAQVLDSAGERIKKEVKDPRFYGTKLCLDIEKRSDITDPWVV